MTAINAYRKAQEAVQLARVQWQASIVRSAPFPERRKLAEAYGLALAVLSRASITVAMSNGSAKG